MKSWNLVLLVLVVVELSSAHHGYEYWAHPHKQDDEMGAHDKMKLQKLAAELILDSKVKYRQTLDVQNKHQKRTPFEIGLVIGKLRVRYQRMMDYYREMEDRFKWNTRLYSPAMWWNKPYYALLGVEYMRTFEMDIDHMVHMLEVLPEEYLDKNYEANMMAKKFNRTRTSAKQGLRENTEQVTMNPKRKFVNESKLKEYYRDIYDQKHGHNSNWTLDQYYGFE